ncbi:uncharacterized protein BCR38DRAFT_491200 [Pseudomassariella vexata]|uniref:Uncharacterized protein n=1 Tax=Pseudomassariella vexata TaxID=1141098 RepID=A0A1Y2D7P8_9PEZI|nr:uncharacterized protein BCR38DRAFT_491200 [Pseudomassariella vexata]ORY55289.1 hypothetical protein BCR38DRAFT_491200 [Pseudomassariella vexata]
MDSAEPDGMEPIAVVGLGCRFPGDATSPTALWDMLTRGESAWSEFPEDRVNISSYFHPSGNRQGSICFRGAHFLKQDVAAFDSSFFSIPADEAKAVDPQQRMLLEVAVEALDNAGVDRTAFRKSETGVWVGSFVKDYEQIVLRDPDNSPIYGATGNGIAIMSNRISYFLDVNGPSMTIDTGCSASLVCVHNACQALRDGEINVGLAGGAGLILTPNTMMPMTALNFLSPDGKCYTFDARANGYGRGEGIGIVVLKRLSDAIRDNDNIRAVIRGSRVNQDGRTPGITLPSSEAQTRNIRGVYKRAKLDFDRTAFVECHGTGTQAGDVRELKAISSALCGQRPTDRPMYVGSIKTNIGHLEGCAGIAGLIKGILTVEHGIIPKHLNFEAPGNSVIDFEGWKVKVPVENTPWPVDGLRRASINCFGFGGTNAHVIIDDTAHYLAERGLTAHHSTAILEDMRDPSLSYVLVKTTLDAIKTRATALSKRARGSVVPRRDEKSHLFVFSAHEQRALSRIIENQINYLKDHLHKHQNNVGPGFLEDLAYTLGCRRTKMQWRVAIAAQDTDDLIDKLRAADKSGFIRTSEDKTASVAFVFGGQGAQWFAMGRELMGFDIFMQSIVCASDYLSDKLNSPFSLIAELLKDEHSTNVNEPHISQPTTTAIQVALVDLVVRHYGVTPASVVGHSSGEIAAAYAMGAISREMAWELAYYRGLCAKYLADADAETKGQMLAVGLGFSEVQVYVDRVETGKVVVACINSPVSVTLSGDSGDIMEVQRMLHDDGVFNRLLVVNVAYHSHHMLRCVEKYFELIAHLKPRQPARKPVIHPHARGKPVNASDIESESPELLQDPSGDIPVMFSSVSGSAVDWTELGPLYWVSNMVSPVRFSAAMTAMMHRADGKKPDMILELGPHATLQSPIQQIFEADPKVKHAPVYFSMLRRNKPATMTALQAIGELWNRGCNVEMAWVVMRNISFRRPKLITDLPNYPWNHEIAYWHESHLSRANRFQVHGRYDLIGRPTADSVPFQPRWRGFLRVQENPWIEHHQVQKTTLYPAAGMVAMVIEGAKQMAPGSFAGIELSQFRIDKAMIIPSSSHGLEYALNMSKHEDETRNRPRKSSYSAPTSTAPVTYDFSIYSKPLDAAWQQHGRGLVTIHNSHSPHQLDGHAAKERALKAERYYNAYLESKKICDEFVIPRQLYETLDVIGMNYGPLFQNITSLQKRDNKCNFTVRIPDTKSVMPAGFEFPHIIHPATLDGIFQTAFSMGDDSMVPSYIGSIYISADPLLPTQAGTELVGHATAARKTFRDATVSFVVADESWKSPTLAVRQKPLIVIKDMTFTALITSPNGGDGVFLPNHHNLCSEIIWEPQPADAVTENQISGQSDLPVELEGGVFLLIPDLKSPALNKVCNAIMKKLVKCQVRNVASIGDGKDLPAYCLSLLEAFSDQYFLWKWSEDNFLAFRTLVNSTKGLFWVTRGAQVDSVDPQAALFQAMACTLHSEDLKKHLVSYDLSHDSELESNDAIDMIKSLFLKSFSPSHQAKYRETEYAARGGQLLVPRLIPINSLNRMIEQGSTGPEPALQMMNQQRGRPLELKVREIGKPDSLYWADDSHADLPLALYEVKIKVLSVGLSVLDIDIVMGRGRDNSIGTDVYGIVEAVGNDVHGLNIGARVLAIARGSFRTHISCHQCLVQQVSDDIDDPSVVVLPTSMAVADYALYATARLKSYQTVLVHAGGGSFGQAAIRMAKFIGARVFATVRNDEQRHLLREYYQLPDDWILDANNTSFTESIMRLTHNEGVNVIFDPTAEYRDLNHACVAHSGHIVCFTKRDMTSGTTVDFTGKTFTSNVLDLAYLIKHQPRRLGESFQFLCSFDLKEWMPPLVTKCDYDDLPKAIGACGEDSHCGPTYCQPSESKPVPILPPRPHPVSKYLHEDATYVLAGQGGLGMQIAKLLASYGVKNIALLSRSGASSETSQMCLAFLKNRGVNVSVMKVDLCDRDSLATVVADIKRTMPPIKGLFQCAAKIRDAVFDNMTHDDWDAATGPKTKGSMHLYELFPRDMDFFIFLSSSAGVIGNRGQANYAVGNAFQDALARHIDAKGQMRSVSIDLGPVLGAGMLAEDPATLDKLKASGFFGIRLKDFERVVERAITGYTVGDERIPPQVVIGVGTGGLIRQNKPADPYWTRTALFSHLNKVDMPPESESTAAEGSSAEKSVKFLLSQVTDTEDAQVIVCKGLMHMLAQSMNMKVDDVDEGKPLSAYGVDSLVAVGVRNWVFRECGVDVSVFEVLSDSSIAELSAKIVKK